MNKPFKTYEVHVEMTIRDTEESAELIEEEALDAIIDVVEKYNGLVGGGITLTEIDGEDDDSQD